jgi:hypothetical protein
MAGSKGGNWIGSAVHHTPGWMLGRLLTSAIGLEALAEPTESSHKLSPPSASLWLRELRG